MNPMKMKGETPRERQRLSLANQRARLRSTAIEATMLSTAAIASKTASKSIADPFGSNLRCPGEATGRQVAPRHITVKPHRQCTDLPSFRKIRDLSTRRFQRNPGRNSRVTV